MEYKTIWEYQNFIYFHPEIKQIVPSHDINKNFKLLSLLRKKYPYTELELMVNEGCLQGCPNRIFHESVNIDNQIIINNDICLSGSYATSFCYPVLHEYPVHSLVIGNHIFPWDIEEYNKIGINNFKLVGRDGYIISFEKYLNSYKMYLKGIDNIKNIQNYPLSDLMYHLRGNKTLNNILVKDYKKYLPDIKHFKKNGHLCTSRCGVECRYCYKCAEKIKKVYENKMKNNKKQYHNVNACIT